MQKNSVIRCLFIRIFVPDNKIILYRPKSISFIFQYSGKWYLVNTKNYIDPIGINTIGNNA